MLFSVAILYLIAGCSWGFALAYNPKSPVINVVNKFYRPRRKAVPLFPPKDKPRVSPSDDIASPKWRVPKGPLPPGMDMLQRAQYIKSNGSEL